MYIADFSNHRVRRVYQPTQMIGTWAGNGSPGSSGDGGPATAAELAHPYALASDFQGNVYIADYDNHRVRRVDSVSGLITTVAGTGAAGSGGDGGLAVAAQLNHPTGVALDDAKRLYIADRDNHRVRRVDPATGNISTVAGNGAPFFGGDGGVATLAKLNQPWNITLDAAWNLYIADKDNHRIRKVDAATGLISTVAGSGAPGFNGDGIPATAANLFGPTGVATGSDGKLYIGDAFNHRVRQVPLGVPVEMGVAFTVTPTSVIRGQVMTLTLSVTNTTGAQVDGLAPTMVVGEGASLVTMVSGPVPASVAVLGAGDFATFTWTYVAAGQGTVRFGVHADGTGNASGLQVAATT
ncbi:MAG: hypothetical protein AAB368_11510, partial [bacterium]